MLRQLAIACGLVGVMVTVSPAGAGYRILSNHFGVWQEIPGSFESLSRCEAEAAVHAVKSNTQTGCLSDAQLQVWRAQHQFEQAANQCAFSSGVQLTLKPGSRVSYLGTAQQRFDFDACMTQSGHDLRSTR